MNKTLVIIQGHKGVRETLARHWPYFKLSGCDLCGAASDNEPLIWPETIPMINLGPETGRGGDSLPRNLIRTLEGFMAHPGLKDYTMAMVVEYDCVFVSPVFFFSHEMGAHLAGGPYPGLKASNFFHPPWIFNREFIPKVIMWGNHMIAEGDIEKGYTDFFLGRMADRFGFVISHVIGIYSQNTMDRPECQEQCRLLIQEGRVRMVHGIKTADQLKATIP